MSLKKKIALIVIGLFALTILILPFLIISDINKAIELSFGLVSAITGIGTLILAFLLYDKFGLKKTIVEKKAKVVFELLEELNGKEFSIHIFYNIDDSKKKVNTYYESLGLKMYSKIFSRESRKEHKGIMKAIVLVNSKNYKEKLQKIFTISNSIWLPKEISEKLYFLTEENLKWGSEPRRKNKKVGLLYFDNLLNSVASPLEKDNSWHTISHELTFEEFLDNTEQLIQACKNWIFKYTDVGYEINI